MGKPEILSMLEQKFEVDGTGAALKRLSVAVTSVCYPGNRSEVRFNDTVSKSLTASLFMLTAFE